MSAVHRSHTGFYSVMLLLLFLLPLQLQLLCLLQLRAYAPAPAPAPAISAAVLRLLLPAGAAVAAPSQARLDHVGLVSSRRRMKHSLSSTFSLIRLTQANAKTRDGLSLSNMRKRVRRSTTAHAAGGSRPGRASHYGVPQVRAHARPGTRDGSASGEQRRIRRAAPHCSTERPKFVSDRLVGVVRESVVARHLN